MKNTNDFWSNSFTTTSESDFLEMLSRTEKSLVWKKVDLLIKKKFGSYNNLNVIEIGAGLGMYSFLMAKKGANVTLLDYSDSALMKADILFKKHDLGPILLKADLLSYQPNKTYDVVMSFGLAEHFLGEQEDKIFLQHYSLTKVGGISIICVPNKYCLPYRIWLIVSKIMHLWVIEEYPRSYKELLLKTKKLGYKNRFVIFGSFVGSWARFMSPIRFVKKYLLKKKNIITKSERSNLLDIFAYEIALVGEK